MKILVVGLLPRQQAQVRRKVEGVDLRFADSGRLRGLSAGTADLILCCRWVKHQETSQLQAETSVRVEMVWGGVSRMVERIRVAQT